MSNKFIINSQEGSIKSDDAIVASKLPNVGSLGGSSFELNVESSSIKIFGELVNTSSFIMNPTASILYSSNSFYPNKLDAAWNTISSRPWYSHIESSKNINEFLTASNALYEYYDALPQYDKITYHFTHFGNHLDAIMLEDGRILCSAKASYVIFNPTTNSVSIPNIPCDDTTTNGNGSYKMTKLSSGEICIQGASRRLLYNPIGDTTISLELTGSSSSSSPYQEKLYTLNNENIFEYNATLKRARIGNVVGSFSSIPGFPVSSNSWSDCIKLSDGSLFFGPSSESGNCHIYSPSGSWETISGIPTGYIPSSWNPILELNVGNIFIAPGGTRNSGLLTMQNGLILNRSTGAWSVTSLTNIDGQARFIDCVQIDSTRIFCTSLSSGVSNKIYNLSNDTWTDYPFDSSIVSSTNLFSKTLLLSDGRVFMCPNAANSVGAAIFDPNTGSYTFTGKDPVGQRKDSMITLSDGRILVSDTLKLSLLDFKNNTIEQITPPSGASSSSPLTAPIFLKDDRVAFVLGYQRIAIYNLVSKTWQISSYHPLGSAFFQGLGKIYALPDGRILMPKAISQSISAICLIYNVQTNQWTSKTHTTPYVSQWGRAKFLKNGKILLIENFDGAGGTGTKILDPLTDEITYASNALNTYYASDCVYLPNGDILAPSTSYTSSATGSYVYSTDTNSWKALDYFPMIEAPTRAGERFLTLGTGEIVFSSPYVSKYRAVKHFKSVRNISDLFLQNVFSLGVLHTLAADGSLIVATPSCFIMYKQKDVELPANWSLCPLLHT